MIRLLLFCQAFLLVLQWSLGLNHGGSTSTTYIATWHCFNSQKVQVMKILSEPLWDEKQTPRTPPPFFKMSQPSLFVLNFFWQGVCFLMLLVIFEKSCPSFLSLGRRSYYSLLLLLLLVWFNQRIDIGLTCAHHIFHLFWAMYAKWTNSMSGWCAIHRYS